MSVVRVTQASCKKNNKERTEINIPVVYRHTRLAINRVLKDFVKKKDSQLTNQTTVVEQKQEVTKYGKYVLFH